MLVRHVMYVFNTQTTVDIYVAFTTGSERGTTAVRQDDVLALLIQCISDIYQSLFYILVIPGVKIRYRF